MFIEHDVAFVGIRVARQPLHERPAGRIHYPGALKPSVAAAMVFMAGVSAGMHVLDPCCGTGSIVIEAAQRGAVASGGDIDHDRLAAACSNVQASGVKATLCLMDSRQLPLERECVERIVTNMPWGRQVTVDSALQDFYAQTLCELRRVLQPDGRVTILTNTPHLVRAYLECLDMIELSLFGQRPVILHCSGKKPG